MCNFDYFFSIRNDLANFSHLKHFPLFYLEKKHNFEGIRMLSQDLHNAARQGKTLLFQDRHSQR